MADRDGSDSTRRGGICRSTGFCALDGDIAIDKVGRRRLAIAPHTFIGALAFLLARSASATVTVAAGARYVDRAALRRLQARAPSLAVSLSAALNKDMAKKVARA